MMLPMAVPVEARETRAEAERGGALTDAGGRRWLLPLRSGHVRGVSVMRVRPANASPPRSARAGRRTRRSLLAELGRQRGEEINGGPVRVTEDGVAHAPEGIPRR